MHSARLIGLLAVLGAGCSGPEAAQVCTAEFRSYTVTAVDTAGAPVNGLTVDVVILRTGKHPTPGLLALYTPGTYAILDDGARNELLPSGDPVRVVGTKGALGFQADYRFDVPGGCHVNKVSGPDTVVVR